MNQKMKKKRGRRYCTTLFVIVMLWAFPTGAMAAGPLELSSRALKAGTVKEGVTITENVTLENRGDDEIVIKNISTS